MLDIVGGEHEAVGRQPRDDVVQEPPNALARRAAPGRVTQQARRQLAATGIVRPPVKRAVKAADAITDDEDGGLELSTRPT